MSIAMCMCGRGGMCMRDRFGMLILCGVCVFRRVVVFVLGLGGCMIVMAVGAVSPRAIRMGFAVSGLMIFESRPTGGIAPGHQGAEAADKAGDDADD